MTDAPQSDSPGSTKRPIVTLLQKIGGALRDFWLMIGITVLLFLGLEGLYRAQAAIRHPRPAANRRAVDSTLHPYAKEPWWGAFQGAEGLKARDNQFDAYRGHVLGPGSSQYLNIDSAGLRITPQPAPAGTAPRRVFMLGGSTMWGYTVRDSFTIPALVAAELHRRGITDVRVVNLAQVGYNTTQDAITLLVELAHGDVPAAVVALDGFNDIATAVEFGVVGRTYEEGVVKRTLERGRRKTWEEVLGLADRSALITGLRKRFGANRQEPVPHPAPDSLCAEVARYYHGIARATDGMGRASGFPVLTFLQPFPSASHKPRSPWESTFRHEEVYAQCAAAIEARMAADPDPIRFLSLTGVFDADTATVFVDNYSHLTEAASRQIAERIADELMPLLKRSGTSSVSRPQ